jgi:hypothetical protein
MLFGKAVPELRPVSIAVRRDSKIVLIDGVDLRTTRPNAATEKSNKIAHTFWQYRRFRTTDLVGMQAQIELVGIVLNGKAKQSRDYLDAHDYALHQFQTEADISVDAGSGAGLERFQAALSG